MSRLDLGPTCDCGHSDVAHDLGTRKADLGQRTACSVSTGPRGIPCPCTRFSPADETTGTAA